MSKTPVFILSSRYSTRRMSLVAWSRNASHAATWYHRRAQAHTQERTLKHVLRMLRNSTIRSSKSKGVRIFCCVISYNIILCCAISYNIISCCVIACNIISCYRTPYHTTQEASWMRVFYPCTRLRSPLSSNWRTFQFVLLSSEPGWISAVSQ